jgi:hypothetical protein
VNEVNKIWDEVLEMQIRPCYFPVSLARCSRQIDNIIRYALTNVEVLTNLQNRGVGDDGGCCG